MSVCMYVGMYVYVTTDDEYRSSLVTYDQPTYLPTYSGAAGFSCCENVVFGFKSAVSGVSRWVGRQVQTRTHTYIHKYIRTYIHHHRSLPLLLYILGIRALMPVHVICAGLQAIGWAKVCIYVCMYVCMHVCMYVIIYA